MLLIYTTNNTTRLAYIAEVLFSSVIKADYTITTNADEFTGFEGPKINYSPSSIPGQEICIKPHSLLFEAGIQSQNIECFEWNNLKAFFKTNGDIAFDVFAASFYLITRYEEYLPHTKDEYGRYAYTNSIAFKNGFLHLPLVNLWMKEVVRIITASFSRFTIHDSRFIFTPTYDIDIAYAYKGKGTLRNLGGYYKDMFTGKLNLAVERANVNKGFAKDPFDTYNWLDGLHEKHNLQPIYFFLLAERAKGYDKNVNPHSDVMQLLIRQHAAKYITGIHPSWQSGNNESVLQAEINLLRSITGNAVTKSRQHYIRMELPRTYRLLIENNIEEEYTMGYGSINGFRASVASSFHWFDLERETKTNLLIQPYCFMEANSFFEQHFTAEQAAAELQQYHDVVKAVNGNLITLFHNHFITEQPQWLPWRNMYGAFIGKNF